MSEKVKALQSHLSKEGHDCVDSIAAFVERLDRDKAVAASLTLSRDKSEHVFAAVDADGKVVFLPGGDDYLARLEEITTARGRANIGIVMVGDWPPPCPDPLWCTPVLLAWQQHHFTELLESAGRGPKDDR